MLGSMLGKDHIDHGTRFLTTEKQTLYPKALSALGFARPMRPYNWARDGPGWTGWTGMHIRT